MATRHWPHGSAPRQCIDCGSESWPCEFLTHHYTASWQGFHVPKTLSCKTCGCLVGFSEADLHVDWHHVVQEPGPAWEVEA